MNVFKYHAMPSPEESPWELVHPDTAKMADEISKPTWMGVQCRNLMTQAATLAIIFGVDDQIRNSFPDGQSIMLEYRHEQYQAGELRPKPGGGTAFIVAIIEEEAGGIPKPEDKSRVMLCVARRLLGIMKNKGGKFVPSSNVNDKRQKFLTDLDKLGDTQ